MSVEFVLDANVIGMKLGRNCTLRLRETQIKRFDCADIGSRKPSS